MATQTTGQAATAGGEAGEGSSTNQSGSNGSAAASNGAGAGGQSSGAPTTPAGGGGESNSQSELDQLKAENARLQKELQGTQRAADQGRSQASSLEERLAEIEASNAQLKADIEAKDKALATEASQKRTKKAIAEASLKFPEEHRDIASDALVRLQHEGDVDFSAEDPAPVIKKALELLKERRPKLFETPAATVPVHPMFSNGVSQRSKDGKPDWREKDGERIF